MFGRPASSASDTLRMRRSVVFLVLAALAIGTLGLVLGVRRGSAVPQPVQFNHLKHTEELGLECEFCHAHVKTSAHAGLPGSETCSVCHQSRQGTSEEAARVTELLAEGEPLRFNKLFHLAPDVFYTHRRHVGIAGLECVTCHGAIAKSERPPRRALVRVSMDFCMDCHRERKETLDCNACHR